MEGEVRKGDNDTGTGSRIIGTGTMRFFVLFDDINVFLYLFSNSHISSTSSPLTIVQTGKTDPLNAFI